MTVTIEVNLIFRLMKAYFMPKLIMNAVLMVQNF